MGEDLVKIPGAEVRARRRPWTIVMLFVWEAALGLVLGSSIASVASSAYARHPDGDDPLFAAGGLALMDLLRHSVAARGPILSATLVVALLARIGGLLPASVAFAELAFATGSRRAPAVRDVAPRALGAFPAAVSVTMLAVAVQGTLLTVGFAGAAAASSWATTRFGEPRGDVVAAVVALFTFLAAGWIGVGGDLARAAVVQSSATALDAVRMGGEVLVAHPIAVPWSAAWRSAAALVPVGLVALLGTHLSSHGTAALLAMAAFHQVVILVRVAIRASWMAKALRLVGA